jgi:hypothetical protein
MRKIYLMKNENKKNTTLDLLELKGDRIDKTFKSFIKGIKPIHYFTSDKKFEWWKDPKTGKMNFIWDD